MIGNCQRVINFHSVFSCTAFSVIFSSTCSEAEMTQTGVTDGPGLHSAISLSPCINTENFEDLHLLFALPKCKQIASTFIV